MLTVSPDDAPAHVRARRRTPRARPLEPTRSVERTRAAEPRPPSHRGGRHPRRRGHWALTLLKWTTVAFIWLVVGLACAVLYFARDLPDTAQVASVRTRPSVTVLAADGRTTLARYGQSVGDVVPVVDLPPHLVQAVLSIEDRSFYDHWGVDPRGIARALWANWQEGGRVQGGSTITQQLAKNLFLSPERTLERKVQEVLLAFWLEHRYDKDQILGAYLNRVYFGAGAYGIDAAARIYFGRSARDVNLREAAILAGLLKAPSRFSPFTNRDAAEARAATVLAAMRATGAIAADTPVPAARYANEPGSGGSPEYFGDWIYEQVGGLTGAADRDLIVETTLDPALQRMAEGRLDALIREVGERDRLTEGAVVLMDPDGAVRAMVGGRSHSASQFNRATQGRRQPGSAFKPLVYLAALEMRLSPDTLIEDAPLRVGRWRPANYDGRFLGSVSLSYALAHSLNTPAVRLIQWTGVGAVRTAARRLGILSPLGEDLSLALGTSEVSVLEMAGAYGTIAAGGRAVQPWGVRTIRDRSGTVLYRRPTDAPGQVVDPYVAGALTAMLQDVVTTGTGRAAALPDRPVAGKTGTTNEHKDAWFIGFTADFVCAVWLGNDNGTPMRRVTGGTHPARLWREVVAAASEGLPPRNLPALGGAWGPLPTALMPEKLPTLQTAAGDDALGRLIDSLADEVPEPAPAEPGDGLPMPRADGFR